jgi:hypothetical protein
MPTWTSPLFTDIRNALGESVVFSNWKGRPYMRSWVKPSNPQTNLQQAGRDIMRNLVARYQSDVIVSAATPEHSDVWNAEALPYQISGFNLFVKFGRKSSIAVPATASGSGTANVTVTYTLGLPASKAKIYHLKGSTWTRVATALTSGVGQTISVPITVSGTYTFYIADDEALDGTDTAPQHYQAITCWGLPASGDMTKAVAATCVVTIS